MKNKVIYLFIVIFSISLITSAKKIQGTCKKSSACISAEEKRKETKKPEDSRDTEDRFPSLGIFFFSI